MDPARADYAAPTRYGSTCIQKIRRGERELSLRLE